MMDSGVSRSLAVMVVEDEVLIAMDLAMQVEAAGHRVVATAREADAAVRKAEAIQPDVVLMDLRLARGSSGIDAARRMFESWRLRCVFLSGNLDPDTREALLDIEPYAMLSKPVLSTQLTDALRIAAEG
jgi:DNA-binding NarL/FixJ family response regulator